MDSCLVRLLRRCSCRFGLPLAVTLLVVSPAAADFCIGVNCGANDDSFHCHSENALGVQCWDQFDNDCESVSGFARAEAFSCGEGGGAVIGSQLPNALGGFNTFRSQIRKTASSALEREQESDSGSRDMESESDAASDEGADEEDEVKGVVFFSDISAAVEYETWKVSGTEGNTAGALFGWQRTTDTGNLWGVSASYQQAEPDSGGDSLDLINGNFEYGHTIGRSKIWKWAISGTVSSFSGIVDQTLYGGGGQLYGNKYYDNGSVLSGGVLFRYQTGDDLDEDIKTVGYGLAYGFPIGQRLTFDLEGFGVSILDTELDDDSFFTLGASLGIYFTKRFSLSLGYRILEGIDDLESDTITLGTSNRW